MRQTASQSAIQRLNKVDNDIQMGEWIAKHPFGDRTGENCLHNIEKMIAMLEENIKTDCKRTREKTTKFISELINSVDGTPSSVVFINGTTEMAKSIVLMVLYTSCSNVDLFP